MRQGTVVHREARTFDRRVVAEAWLKKRETELREPGALSAARKARSSASLADVIDRYTETSRKEMGRTKKQVLRAIKNDGIGERRCADIASQDLVEFGERLAASMQPQTVLNYMSHLASVFAVARPAWGIPLDAQAMADALKVLKRLGLTRKSRERNRRPTLDELDQILNHFEDRRKRRPSSNPMVKVVLFAIFSTRRLEEITRIAWIDLDEANSRVMVRDMKNPGEKAGNNVWTDLPAEALQVIRSMPRDKQTIFPFNPDAISAAFTRACRLLDIADLHFHDLRHEGISRQFELGRSIPQVAGVSGHRSWSSLKRYTHVQKSGDKYLNWNLEKWLTSNSDVGPHFPGSADLGSVRSNIPAIAPTYSSLSE
jgi:integrase